MSRSQARAVRAAILLTALLALPGSVGAGTRIPVNSTDDATSPAANRIAAVTNIVHATNARLDRVIVAYPSDPCALVTEPTVLCSATEEVVSAYQDLYQSVACVLRGDPSDGLGDAVLIDADAFASDMSQSGIANQLASIATVLGNADDRLGGIRYPSPGPPDDPEIVGALGTLAETVQDGGGAAARWSGVVFPPNPVCPV